MAASTAGMVVLRNLKTGNCRAEPFTMTPSALQYGTWTSNGQSFILTAPEGEQIVDLQFNNDGVTTVTKARFIVDGQDIRNTYLMVLFASDSKMPTRIVTPLGLSGNKQLQIQFLA
jgi:hypothetical protein